MLNFWKKFSDMDLSREKSRSCIGKHGGKGTIAAFQVRRLSHVFMMPDVVGKEGDNAKLCCVVLIGKCPQST